MDDLELTFKIATVELQKLINKRKNSWRLTSVMEFEDVSSIILAHLWKQWSKYDASQPLDRWANTVITNQLNNLLRDNLYKNAKPCTAANSYGACCSFNLGGDLCRWTKSGKQDSTCRFYKKWLARKQSKFAIGAPLSIEDHVDESHSMQDDFLDIEEAKKVIDDNIQRRLSKEEYRIYVFLYVNHLSMEETVKKMGFKKVDANDMRGYMVVRSAAIKSKEVAKQIISECSLIR